MDAELVDDEDDDPIGIRRPPAPTPAREAHVNSDDKPPAHIRRKTPGLADTGGTRRTPTRIVR